MAKRNNKKRFYRTVFSFLTVLSLLFGIIPSGLDLKASAAAPTLIIETGTFYNYSVSKKNPASVSYATAAEATTYMGLSSANGTVTLSQSKNNKVFEIGYVPIIVSLAVPAGTTLRTTLSFNLTGSKGGSGSAVEAMELFDFGTQDRSSSLLFKTDENSSAYTAASDRNKDNSMSASFIKEVEFKNTATAEKKISCYFGFFAAVHYGSTQNHKLSASCKITNSRITDTEPLTPIIKADPENSKTTTLSSISSNTLPKSDFVSDKDWDELTAAEQSREKTLAGRSGDGWSVRRLSLGIPAENELTFSPQVKAYLTESKFAYVPFTVPLLVPAHTTRTFYLLFDITYTRNSDSGSGFFAELIEGDVPDSFNTAASANMTGNTKLRVYSDDGTTPSGTIELPVTFENKTDQDKTYEQNYVFFVGYRKTGLYQPKPTYSIKLRNAIYTSYDEEYDVSVNAANCTYTAPQKIAGITAFSATIKANAHYSLPGSVTVKVKNQTLSSSKYTYSKSTGKITIPKDYVKGRIVVTASAVPDTYTISYSGLTGASLTTKPTTHTYGKTTAVGNPTKTGYVFGGWKIQNIILYSIYEY